MRMEKSFWYSEKPQYSKLENDAECDVCVIGGGVAGLSAAYEFAKSGQRVVVLEKDRVCAGQSGRSSAIVSYAHDLLYYRLKKMHGIETAKEYYKINLAAAKRLEEIVKEEKIDCGYQALDGIFYACTKKGEKELIKEANIYTQIGAECEFVSGTELKFETRAAMKIKGLAVINPYDYVHGLAAAVVKNGGVIFEDSPATEKPSDGVVQAGDFTVRAKKFIVATNFPYFDLPGFYFAKLYRHRSFNAVFSSDIKINSVYEPCDKDGLEYRPVEGGAILACGASVRTGKYKYESSFKMLCGFIADDFFGGDINAAENNTKINFAAQDCMSFDMLPYAGRFGAFTEDVYILTGFNKWGFTTALAAAKQLVLGEGGIYSPQRLKPVKAVLNTVANVGALVAEFSDYILNYSTKKLERVKNGQGAIIKHKGKRLGVYRDEKGSLHAVSAVCTHMGCPLKWNKDEKSFDCACHGSRYCTQGRVIDNPADKNLTKVRIKDERQDI